MRRDPAFPQGLHPMESDVSDGGYGKPMDGRNPPTGFPQPPWKAAARGRSAPSHSHLENVERFPQLPQDRRLLG